MKIEIPQPCHEKWTEMNHTEKGAFCLTCQKEVIDFSQMSDAQIKQHFAQSVGKACGRFRADQLDRPLVSLEPRGTWVGKMWLSVGLFLGITSQSYAQVAEKREAETPIEHTTGDTLALPTPLEKMPPPPPPPPTLGKLEVVVDSSFIIKGKVTDEKKEVLPGVSILKVGTKNGTSTNVDGDFTLQVKQGDTLKITFIGYQDQEIIVTPKLKQPLSIKLEGGYLLGLTVTRPTLWQRFKNLFRRKR